MRTITLKISDRISEKFLWLLSLFSLDEVQILDQSDYISDDEYLRSLSTGQKMLRVASNPCGTCI